MLTETEILLRYLRDLREALFWKVENLDDYDLRRPLTPTGTNLLGLVKHVESVELGYFSEPVGREQPVPTAWIGPDVSFEEDMYANAEQSSQKTYWISTDLLVRTLRPPFASWAWKPRPQCRGGVRSHGRLLCVT